MRGIVTFPCDDHYRSLNATSYYSYWLMDSILQSGRGAYAKTTYAET